MLDVMKKDWLVVTRSLAPKVAEGAARADEEDRFVAESYAALRGERLFSAMVPRELGGGGASYGEVGAILRELAQSCSATALSLAMHQHLVAAAVWNHRNGRPGRALLEKVAASELVLVSTGARDWLGSNGEAKRCDGGFRVSAHKFFASGSPAGDVLVTSVPYDDPAEGPQVLHFPVPFDTAGVRIQDDWRAHGMRGTGSHTVVLDEVFVPEAAVVLRRPRDKFHPVWNVILTVAMPLITSVYVGVAEAAARIARDRTRRRSYDPLTALALGEMENQLATARMAADGLVALANDLDFAAEIERTNQVLVRKTIAVKAALATAEAALEAVGGEAFYRKLGLERLLRDARAGHFHPLPEDKQKLFTGRLAMGLDPVAEL